MDPRSYLRQVHLRTTKENEISPRQFLINCTGKHLKGEKKTGSTPKGTKEPEKKRSSRLMCWAKVQSLVGVEISLSGMALEFGVVKNRTRLSAARV